MSLRGMYLRGMIVLGLIAGAILASSRPVSAIKPVCNTGCCVTDDGYTCCYVGYGSWSSCDSDQGTSCSQGGRC